MTKLSTRRSRIVPVFFALLIVPVTAVLANTDRTQTFSLSLGFTTFNEVNDAALENTAASRHRLPMLAQNNDIGPDGLKRRGDGTIDDDQPGVGFGREHKRLIHNKEKNLEVLEDGTTVRSRTDTWVTPDGTIVRERTETRSVLPDGTKIRERTEKRFNAEGNVIRDRNDIRTVDRSGHGGRRDSMDRPEHMDRSGSPDRPEIDRSGSRDRPDIERSGNSGRH